MQKRFPLPTTRFAAFVAAFLLFLCVSPDELRADCGDHVASNSVQFSDNQDPAQRIVEAKLRLEGKVPWERCHGAECSNGKPKPATSSPVTTMASTSHDVALGLDGARLGHNKGVILPDNETLIPFPFPDEILRPPCSTSPL